MTFYRSGHLHSPAFILATILTVSQITPAFSQNLAKLITIIHGACNKLILEDEDKTSGCRNILMNVDYPDGRSGFWFMIGSDEITAFSTTLKSAIKPERGLIVAPVDLIVRTNSGSERAIGTCRFAVMFNGSSAIDCKATTTKGSYEGHFQYDGSPPDRYVPGK